MDEGQIPTADLARAREEYTRGGLVESDLTLSPYTLFERWYAEAREAGIHEPNAMVLATVDPGGQPSARFVLLKGLRPDPANSTESAGKADGLVFFTNLESRKGRDLAAQPRCTLLFPWHPLERQVRVEGEATPLPREEVAEYFASRPRGSQLGAWASPQSSVVADREELDAAYAEVAARFPGEVPVPDHWGGFLVVPRCWEFWQGRPGRMHDRLVYKRSAVPGQAWTTHRLAP